MKGERERDATQPVSLNSAKMRGVDPEREVVQSDLMLCHHLSDIWLGHGRERRRPAIGLIERFGLPSLFVRFDEIVCPNILLRCLSSCCFAVNFRLLIMILLVSGYAF